MLDNLDPTLLEPVAKPLRAPGEFGACLNQLGTYTTEHFVLRLSPRVHELVDAVTSGARAPGDVDGETIQAYSTYLHETIHWWQHIGSISGLILSLTYPAQAHENLEHLEKVLKLVGPKKSLKRWAEDAARAGLTDEDPGLRAANMAVNNAVDAEFYKIATITPALIPQAMKDPYFETVGHCYWMAYTHAVGLLAATVDRDWLHLPDTAGWQERFIRNRDAKLEGWARDTQVRVAPLGLHALFEGQARMIQLQFLTFGMANPPTLDALKDAGYFRGEYGKAFESFLKATNSARPNFVDDPAVALFLLIVDLAINPTAGFPLDIESFENFIIDVDPGIRFLRLCQSVREEHPELLGRITEYSRQEYMQVADMLTKACGYDHPGVALSTIETWATAMPGVAEILAEKETFRFNPGNVVVRVLFSYFISFSIDKLKRPEFFCWPGAWLAAPRVSENSQSLFLKYLSLFTDRADDDGIFPRNIPGKAPEAITKTLSNFYANIINYDLTRQWILDEGPFRYDFDWLTQTYSKAEMADWAKTRFEQVFRVHPDTFEILSSS
ncbi:hypothetical protein XH89_15780 [Bradyrhizobium sp. CCBAU 53340]|uniref:hypothetical protein n=1 Tax=Bradyrhizobium sp. CCBAU 53340 TaxID=1325112 RepID=UPI001889E9C3|nr:hypothetical protein [Bradyrhizobium sp. CCBAU 53340]QOZ44772.1 hypothetical protein XH89_15780 [Bradyrhizobium sp. CCBAU 53340]